MIHCPNTQCEHLIDKNVKPLICTQCGIVACKSCNLKKHTGRCVISGDAGLRFWAASSLNGVKNCPKCKARTEKNSGCNHMTCGRCGQEWCWICGHFYSRGHYSMGVEGILCGCPGLQTGFGNKFVLIPTLLALWIFCVPLSLLIPHLIALIFGLIMPYKVLYDVCKMNKFNRYTQDTWRNSILKLSPIMLLILCLLFFGILACVSVVLC